MSRELLEWARLKIEKLEEELWVYRMILEVIEKKLKSIESIEPSPEDLDNLDWRKYPSGSGEWIFADRLPRRFLEKLRKTGSLIFGGYTYFYKVLSGGKEVVSRKKTSKQI